MPSNTLNKFLLSASANGRAIPVTGTVTVHSATSFGTNLDEVYLYAINNGTAAVPLNIQWGGTSSYDIFQISVSNNTGRMQIVDGKLIGGALPVMAWITGNGTVAIDGFVNRISGVVTTLIDPIVQEWAARVVRAGGATPTTATQLALTTFVQSLEATNILNKMVAVNCFVADSLIAAQTPLIYHTGNPVWTNHSFVSGDLTINGLIGNSSSKYLDTGISLSNTWSSATNTGFTLYIFSTDSNAVDADFYVGVTASSAFGFQTTLSGGVMTLFFSDMSQNNGAGLLQVTIPPSFTGYLSGNRGSLDNNNIMAIYQASSTVSHQVLVASTTSTGGTLPSPSVFAFAQNPNGAAPIQFSGKRYSFMALHDGLTSVDSNNLFSAVQTLRRTLGGGFV